MPAFTPLIALLSAACLLGCEYSITGIGGENRYAATVIGKGPDCGDTFLVRFAEKGEVGKSLPDGNAVSSESGIYYADGLPTAFKTEGSEIRITFRTLRADEAIACTALGPAYAHLRVTDAAR
jgi:hypothetical protein